MINFKDQNMKSIDDISDPPIFSIKFFEIYNFEISIEKIRPKIHPKKTNSSLLSFIERLQSCKSSQKSLVVDSNHLTTEFGCLAKFCYYFSFLSGW